MDEPNPFADDYVANDYAKNSYGSAIDGPMSSEAPISADLHTAKGGTPSGGKYAELYQVEDELLRSRLKSALKLQSLESEGVYEPDLYAPTWVTLTVAAALYLSRSLSTLVLGLIHGLPPSVAGHELMPYLVMVPFYGLATPLVVHIVARFLFKIQSGWGIVELVSIYGYSMVIWVPLAAAFFVLRLLVDLLPGAVLLVGHITVATVGVLHTTLFLYRQFKGPEESDGKKLWAIAASVSAICAATLRLAFNSWAS
ncbi:LADA_0F06634g1_1 [Lachancea dasiensis]|uniref:LADA_0F06634g1_1 n=1 Tax=Lachancea dasiensis TaxID=1072105 RepID=A0A1G4JK58_9SACH|nr:LADA_0F06634g1_1 [Lachancea dasiensis]